MIFAIDDFRRSKAKATNEKVLLFRELGSAVLDEQISDSELRSVIYQHLYRLNPKKRYSNLESLLKGKINPDRILKRWDDLLHVAGSLKMGWVTASLFVSKLKSYPRQNALTRVLQEYGRLIKTIFILRYLENEQYRRRILIQINIGRIVLDPTISDFQLRSTIYSKVPEEELRTSLEECDQLIRPKDDKSIDYFASRYSYIREFAPKFLEAL